MAKEWISKNGWRVLVDKTNNSIAYARIKYDADRRKYKLELKIQVSKGYYDWVHEGYFDTEYLIEEHLKTV